MPILLCLQGLSNLLTDTADVSQVEISVRLAWRSNTNKRNIRLVDSCRWILRSPQTAISTVSSIISPISASTIGECPWLIRLTLSAIGSTPRTWCPSAAKHPAETAPTYPKPKMLIFNVLSITQVFVCCQ